MRILFVAMANSVHTGRWVNQLDKSGWDVHLFPVADHGVYPGLKSVAVHDMRYTRSLGLHSSVRLLDECWALAGTNWPFSRGYFRAQRIARWWSPQIEDRAWRLAQTIRRLQPVVVHSLEMQHAGYLTLQARNYLRGKFPVWAVSNWGSDIYLFGRLDEHRDRIREVLASCDYYACEGLRDVSLGREFGFGGEVLPVVPNTGGFDLSAVAALKSSGAVSGRRVVLLKGYQGWAGRALVALEAMRRCADVLRGYQIRVYLAGPDVELAVRLLAADTGLDVRVIPNCSHEEMLRWHGKSRVSIGLSISDAISTSFLEALVMGSFPIQSVTSMADEWIADGASGLLVPPEDPAAVAKALRRAISDDALVDTAAAINAQTAAVRLDQKVIRPQVIAMYEEMLKGAKRRQ